MQDDQKDPLSICATDTFKVPLWLHDAASPGFSQKVIKLEYIKMLKTNLSH